MFARAQAQHIDREMGIPVATEMRASHRRRHTANGRSDEEERERRMEKEGRRSEAEQVPGKGEEVVEEEGQQHDVKVVQDAMDWVIARTQQQKQEEGSTSRRTIQIFVKVDGSTELPTMSVTS